ncbi:MAG: hypothetical protein AAFP02_21225, partial [Bacteroidota bacterium]
DKNTKKNTKKNKKKKQTPPKTIPSGKFFPGGNKSIKKSDKNPSFSQRIGAAFYEKERRNVASDTFFLSIC